MGTKESGYGMWQIKCYNDILPNPLEDENVSEYRRSIYCSYTITPDNKPPVAVNDSVFMAETEKAIKINVAKNDYDPDGDLDRTTVSIINAPTHGTAIVGHGTGIVIYTRLSVQNSTQNTRNINFTGSDIFTYTISDMQGAKSNIATVSINSMQGNNPPVANNDLVRTFEDSVDVEIDVLNNDTDIDGDTLNVVKISDPANGKATLKPDHTRLAIDFDHDVIYYTPNPNFNGVDRFTYIISDGNGGFDQAAVFVLIRPVNDEPVAEDDQSDLIKNTVNHTINVLSNDFDIDGDLLTIISITQPDHGIAIFVKADDSLTPVTINNQCIYYTPDRDYFGKDEFTYTISDSKGGEDTATVNLNILSSNDPPFTPSNPDPSDSAMGISIDANLNWIGGDPNGDNVTYDIYFGTTNPPSIEEVNSSDLIYDLGTLSYETTYYWKIVAFDSIGASTEGSIWSFTTENEPENNNAGGVASGNSQGSSAPTNVPPIADASSEEPYQGFIDEEITFDGSLSYDSDGEIISWHWSFGDGDNADGEIVTHSYSKPIAYSVTLTVEDNKGDTDTYKTIVTIVQPNRPPVIPDIYGYEPCFKGTKYSFAALSTDPDKDNIKYIFDWGDGTTDASELLATPQSYGVSFIHNWESAGTYTVTVTVSDNQTASSSELSVVILEPSIDYNVIITLGSIMTIFVVLSLILVKTGKVPKFGKK